MGSNYYNYGQSIIYHQTRAQSEDTKRTGAFYVGAKGELTARAALIRLNYGGRRRESS